MPPPAALALLLALTSGGTLPAAPEKTPSPANRPTSRPAAKAAGMDATRATSCRPVSAWRCTAEVCEAANEGLHAELFELDAAGATVGACLYTDCFSGKARVTREAARPWHVTAVGVVRSDRPVGSVPPPGSEPFPLTVSVDLRTGRFTATWSHSPEGLQVDHGTCELRDRR